MERFDGTICWKSLNRSIDLEIVNEFDQRFQIVNEFDQRTR